MRKKSIPILCLLSLFPFSGQAIVKNSCDTDKVIALIRNGGSNSINWVNPDNPFGDPSTFYCRSTMVVTGGPVGTWRLSNVGKFNSQFNSTYEQGLNNVVLGQAAPLPDTEESPYISTNGLRLVGGVGFSSIGIVPGQTTSDPGSWVSVATAALTGGVTSSSFPSGSVNQVWAVNLAQNCAYLDGANWQDHGPRWPMDRDRINHGGSQQDFHAVGGGLAGETRPEWTDQPIVVSLDFQNGSYYTQGHQLHFARSNDYFLPSENVTNHPNPWQHLDHPTNQSTTVLADEFITEEAVPGILSDVSWHSTTTAPSDVRCELFDNGDFRTLNYGVQSISTNAGFGTGKYKVKLNAVRQDDYKPNLTPIQWGNKSKQNRYRLLNAPQFLRHPGQMYFNSSTGWLYFIPFVQPTATSRIQVLNVSLPYPYRANDDQTTTTYRIAESIIKFEKCQNFQLDGVVFDTFMAMGVKIDDARQVKVSNSVFRNIGSAGVQARNLEGRNIGTEQDPEFDFGGVYACIFQNSYKCIIDHFDDRWNPLFLSGHQRNQGFACGTPANLLYSGNIVELNLPPANVRPAWMNNVATETYGSVTTNYHETLRSSGQLYVAAPAFDLRGDSREMKVEGNTFSNCAGISMRVQGTRGLIANNVFKSCNRDVTDNGAIYMGRELLSVGNTFQDNTFWNMVGSYGDYVNRSKYANKQVSAIMLDDGMWGQTVKNNVFNNADVGITINAGRYNLLERNKFNKINSRMVKMEAAVSASSGFLEDYYKQAKRACGTSPFNDPLSNPDRITFTHSAWNWYKTVGAYSYWTTSSFVPDDLEELNRMKGESQSAWKNDPFAANWLSSFQQKPGQMELMVESGTEGTIGSPPPLPLVAGYRNLFVYATSDFGTVPANELTQLNNDNGGTTGTKFEMGINYRPNAANGSGGEIPSYMYRGEDATLASLKPYRKHMFGMKVTTP